MARDFWRKWLDRLFPRIRPPASGGGPPHPVAWSSMASLLEDLESLAEEHEELFDTDVRERMWAIVDAVLIRQTSEVAVPDEIGMFTPEANEKVQSALLFNLQRLRETFAIFELDTERKRLDSFFNPRLRTERGRRVDDFFGHP